MKAFIIPEMEIIEFTNSEVITQSGACNTQCPGNCGLVCTNDCTSVN